MSGDRHWRPRRVLINYDGTPGGRDAIAQATALAEPLVGSVATGLLHHAHCPVLVVPRPKADVRSTPDGEAIAATEDARA